MQTLTCNVAKTKVERIFDTASCVLTRTKLNILSDVRMEFRFSVAFGWLIDTFAGTSQRCANEEGDHDGMRLIALQLRGHAGQ